MRLFIITIQFMKIKTLFGSNLQAYRKLRNLSQEELAEKLSISAKHLSTLETGKVFVSAELLEKISATLNVSISALFYSPEDKSIDDSDLSYINIIIEEELMKAAIAMKKRIYELKNK